MLFLKLNYFISIDKQYRHFDKKAKKAGSNDGGPPDKLEVLKDENLKLKSHHSALE